MNSRRNHGCLYSQGRWVQPDTCKISQPNLNMFLKKTGPIKLSLTMYLSLYFYETKFFSKLGELYNLLFFALFYSVY